MKEHGNETAGLFAQAKGIESPLAEKALGGHETPQGSWEETTFRNLILWFGIDKSSSDMAQNFLIEVNPQELQVCKEARDYFTCQRPLHVALLSKKMYSQSMLGILSVSLSLGQCASILGILSECQALDIYATAKHRGTLNVSQHVDRMTHGDRERVQCITPKAILWHPPSKRPLTGRTNSACLGVFIDSG